MTDSDQLLQFPCTFPIKAMGLAEPDFDALVVGIVRRHVPDLVEGAVSTRPSSGGRWLSVTVTIEAASREQLDDIYRSLHAHEKVKMTL